MSNSTAHKARHRANERRNKRRTRARQTGPYDAFTSLVKDMSNGEHRQWTGAGCPGLRGRVTAVLKAYVNAKTWHAHFPANPPVRRKLMPR